MTATASSTTLRADAAPDALSGMLQVRIVEARNLPFPPGVEMLPLRPGQGQGEEGGGGGGGGKPAKVPYAVLEFDKNELIAMAREVSVGKRTLGWNQKTYLYVGCVCRLGCWRGFWTLRLGAD